MLAVVRLVLDDELGEKGGQIGGVDRFAEQVGPLVVHHDLAEQPFLAAEIAAHQRDVDARAAGAVAQADAVVTFPKESPPGCCQNRSAGRLVGKKSVSKCK